MERPTKTSVPNTRERIFFVYEIRTNLRLPMRRDQAHILYGTQLHRIKCSLLLSASASTGQADPDGHRHTRLRPACQDCLANKPPGRTCSMFPTRSGAAAVKACSCGPAGLGGGGKGGPREGGVVSGVDGSLLHPRCTKQTCGFLVCSTVQRPKAEIDDFRGGSRVARKLLFRASTNSV